MANRFAIAVLLVVGACTYEGPREGDDDIITPPVVRFEYPDSGADEGAAGTSGSTVQIPVILSKPAESRVTVKCTALPGSTATEINDFVVNTLDVTFEIGEMRKDVSVDILKDVIENEGESFSLALSDPVGAKLDPENAIHLVNISDTILPRISFLNLSTTTSEATQTMLELRLDLPADGPSTVVIGVSPGVTAPVDSEDIGIAEGHVVSIPSGAMSVQVPILENADDLHENPTENVTFELKGASQNLVIDIDKKISTHAITDDDAAPIVDFQVTASSVNENAGTVEVTVRLSAESGLPVTIGYNRQANDSAADDDATVNGSSVTFDPRTPGVAGQQTKVITVMIEDDVIDEDPETVIIDLDATPTNATRGGNTTHTLTINADNSDPRSVVSFDVTSSTRAEGDSGMVNHAIQINITPASGRRITLPFTLGGNAEEAGSGPGSNDYDVVSPNPLTIEPGNITANLTIRVFGDNDQENPADETVTITLQNPGTTGNATLGANTSHTLTIDDSD
jgi:hypothetical protein